MDRLDVTYVLMALMAWVMGPLAFIIAIAEWRKRGDRFR